MTAPFVPLTLAPSGDPGNAASTFRPLACQSSVAKTHPTPSAAAVDKPCEAEPVISVDREGDQITRIRVQCACGRVIELDCTY